MAGAEALWPLAYDAAIFDFDGTLAYSGDVWHEVDRLFLAKRGIPYEQDLDEALAPLTFEGCAEYVRERFHLDERIEDICREWNEIGVELYTDRIELRPGAHAYLQALVDAGVPCALATTNDPQVIAASNHRTHVRELFSAQVYGTDVNAPKTKPDIYLEAARRLGVAPERCIVFEDVIQGIRSAKSAGMATCAIATDGNPANEAAKAAEADVFITSWEEVPLP